MVSSQTKSIVVLSGKGGVGKSTISASLAFLLARKNKIIAADCDVDAANLALLFNVERLEKKEKISTNLKAFINNNSRYCPDIVKNCAFSAISWNKEKNLPEINQFLCEGCGVCKILCPEGITLKKVKNAVIGEVMTEYGFYLISGQLEMGESGSGKVVNVVKDRAKSKAAEEKANFLIIDSAPGIGCPVIASINGSDYVLAVTEPTPVAFSALRRVLRVVEHFGVKYGIIINKWDLNRGFVKQIEDFADENNVKIIAKIPYQPDFVKAMMQMRPIVEINPVYQGMFNNIIKQINLALI